LLLAPPDYHLLIDDSFISLDTDQQVKYSRPSIDVTLISAAETYGARVAGLVLTGANDDGAAGLRRIADRGGVALVEDPTTATSAAMPAAALRAVPQARVLGLADIPAALVRLADEPMRRPA
jgi:two-component system chemotaxis response regulator CheB